MSSLRPSENSHTEVLPQIAVHELIRCIGEGAFGKVWLAKNVIGGFRAVKVVWRKKFPDDRTFRLEFEAIRRFEPISHSHAAVVQILQIGQNEEDGYYYYVMNLADDVSNGQRINPETYVPLTLQKRLADHPLLPMETRFQIAFSLISGVKHLHENGLIHRDIKPSNIIFINGEPKLADIGLVTETGREVTAVRGTPEYAPTGGVRDPSGDIFSIGKVLYVLFFGMKVHDYPKLPRDSEDLTSNPTLAGVNDIILKACHDDPQQRFQSVEEFHQAMRKVRGPDKSTEILPPERTIWTRKTFIISLLLLLLVVGVGVGLFLKNRHEAERIAATAAASTATNAPVIVLMDTTVPKGVYDKDNIPSGRCNADELYDILAGLDGIVSQKKMYQVRVGVRWAGEAYVAGLRPDLVIIHRSSFFHPLAGQLKLTYPPDLDPKNPEDAEKIKTWQAIYDSQDDVFRGFVKMVGENSTNTHFLVYSRGTDPNWLDEAYREYWVKTLESKQPNLTGRIHTMVIEPWPDGTSGSFRNPATTEKTTNEVSKILKKLNFKKPEADTTTK